MFSIKDVKTQAVTLSIAGAIALSSVMGPSMASADSPNRASSPSLESARTFLDVGSVGRSHMERIQWRFPNLPGDVSAPVGIIVPDIIIDPTHHLAIIDPIYREAIIDLIHREASRVTLDRYSHCFPPDCID